MLESDEIITLSQLTGYVKQVLTLNFDGPIWIQAELGQVGSSRGHTYLNLIETDSSGKETTRIKGTIWYSTLKTLKQQHDNLDQLLERGREVLLCCTVEFHDVFGFSVNIVDLDPSFTLGKMEQKRLAAIKALQADGSIDKNARLSLTPVPRSIAVISSSRAAGWNDFHKQLTDNEYGYTFKYHLFECAMQGAKVQADISSALDAIRELHNQFDCIVIIRGGGSKLDLIEFDNEDLARNISTLPLPVIAGIGHEIDFSLVDLVAHTNVKTPTAAADYLISRIVAFESQCINLGLEAIQRCKQQQNAIRQQTESRIQTIQYRLDQHIRSIRQAAERQQECIKSSIQQHLKTYNHELIQAETASRLLHPDQVLKRGFALVRSQDKAITSAKNVKPNTSLTITLHDGEIKTTSL